MDFLTELRKEREHLAITLQKHKGIRRIIEDFYPDNAHFIYELLQNAEDASAPHAWFELHKDHLIFIHDGARHFDERDVSSITDIGESSKQEDTEKIGKFGVGFKSVFSYTETPRIYSKRFCFQITNLVLPEAITPKPEVGEKTQFEFPFNNSKKQVETAFSEIKAGLEALSETTLLFLKNLHEIRWRIDDSDSGSVSRTEHPENHIEVRKDSGTGTVSSVHWLRFTAPVDELPKQNVAVAYELGFLHEGATFDLQKRLSEQVKIIPSQGKVSVFFPAEKESSELRFHLHAPFVPELSRASIKDTSANLPLFEQLATLAARSLHAIRDLGLLTGEFLGVLPNPEDSLPERYECIRNAIIEEMQNEPLTPTHNKGHAPAQQLVQAKAILKELLSEEDLRYLMEWEDEEPKWAIGAQQKNSRQDRFLEGLDIQAWDVAEFIEILKEKTFEGQYSWENEPDEEFLSWLGTKNEGWHQQMYAMLYKELSEDEDFSQLTNLKIVRLSDSFYSVGSECYFPSENLDYDEIMPRVARAVYSSGARKTQQTEAKKLLEAIGIREIGEIEEIERILKERYQSESDVPNDKTHLADIKRFMSFLEKNFSEETTALFQNYYIFKLDDAEWGTPDHVFIDVPYKDTFLSTYYERLPDSHERKFALSSSYKDVRIPPERLAKFAEAVGAQARLTVEKTTTLAHRDADVLRQDHSPGVRYLATDENWTIPGLDSMMAPPSINLSRLLWKTLCEYEKTDISIFTAKCKPKSQHKLREKPSTLTYLLREKPWVPQKNGNFVTPAQAFSSQLPKGFPFDEGWEWLKVVDFGENEKKRSEEFQQREAKRIEFGFESEEELERALQLVKLLSVEEQQRILAEYTQRRDFELPENTPSNPQRRGEKISEQAKAAPERIFEERTRSVAIGLEDVKAEANQYLRQQYTNRDDQMICQVCKDELPFKKNNGDYYFECVEFLIDLPGRHYQNYLALCPNHAAMFQHANGSKELLQKMFKNLEGKEKELEVVLAQRDMTIYLTETHIADLKAVFSVSSNREGISDIKQSYE
ncbi:MAG: sacsin N-terminal ATP-binding-like domain-containing protein [Candidatus Binatia bacterium]